MRARTLLVAAPAAVSALVGLAHPVFLTPETADRWLTAHLLLLPVFPLVGFALLWVLRGEQGPLVWAARAAAYAWAVLYSALDAIAGIGAAFQLRAAAQRGDARPPIEDLFTIGDRLGQVGAYGLVVAGLLTAAALARRSLPLAVVGGLLVALGAEVVRRHHVFPPKGVLGMLAVAAGTLVLALAAERRAEAPAGAGRWGRT